MPQLINLPNGQQASFPDGMPQADIEKVLQTHFKPQEKTGLAAAAELADPINAFGGGVAQGIVKTGAAVGGLLTDALPEDLKQTVRGAGRQVGQALSPSPDSIPGQAMQQYPTTAAVGDVVGQVAPYAIPGVGAKAVTNYALGGIAGAASAEDGFLNRLVGGTLGLATTGLVDAVASAAQAGLSALRGTALVKQAEKYVLDKVADMAKTLKGTPREVGAQSAANVYNVTRQVDNELFDVFRKVPGNVAPEIRTVKRQIEDMLDSYSVNMSGPQKQALETGLQKFETAGSLADLHDMRKFLAQNSKVFTPAQGDVFSDAYKTIRKNVDTQMDEVAKKLGVLDEYKNANAHYQEKMLPLLNAGTDDVAKALSEQGMRTDPTQAAKVLDEWVDKNIKANSPNEIKAFLNTLDPVGREAVELRFLEKSIDKIKDSSNIGLAFRKELKKYGPSVDALLSGQNKKMVVGISRVLDEAKPLLENQLKKGEFLNMPAQAAISVLTSATSTAPGQFILKLLGEPSTPKALIKEFLSKGTAIVGGTATNALLPQDAEEQQTSTGQQ